MNDASSATSTGSVEARGIRFAYSSSGSGPIVLDAHGLSSSRKNNRIMQIRFDAVADAHRTLIAYDARGHGESSGSLDSADYTWTSLAEDLLALADRFSPDAPISAIGSSMGTGTLIHAALTHPARFDRLVLTAPPTAWATRAAQAGMYRTMADFVETNGYDAVAGMLAAAPIPPVFVGVDGFPPMPDIAAELAPTVFRGAALADLPDAPLLAAITAPTLILAWTGDPGHPVETAERLAATLPNASLHISDTNEDFLTWGDRAAAFITG